MRLCRDCKYFFGKPNDKYGKCSIDPIPQQYHPVTGHTIPLEYNYASSYRKFSWLCGEGAKWFKPRLKVVPNDSLVIEHDPDEHLPGSVTTGATSFWKRLKKDFFG